MMVLYAAYCLIKDRKTRTNCKTMGKRLRAMIKMLHLNGLDVHSSCTAPNQKSNGFDTEFP